MIPGDRPQRSPADLPRPGIRLSRTRSRPSEPAAPFSTSRVARQRSTRSSGPRPARREQPHSAFRGQPAPMPAPTSTSLSYTRKNEAEGQVTRNLEVSLCLRISSGQTDGREEERVRIPGRPDRSALGIIALLLPPLLIVPSCSRRGASLELEFHEGTDMEAAPSPDGRYVALQLWSHIWILDTGNGKARRLTDAITRPDEHMSPRWSPHPLFRSESGGFSPQDAEGSRHASRSTGCQAGWVSLAAPGVMRPRPERAPERSCPAEFRGPWFPSQRSVSFARAC